MLIFKSFERRHPWQTVAESVVNPARPRLDVLDAINQRRSVRDYTPGKPDAATLNRLLAAAVRARLCMANRGRFS